MKVMATKGDVSNSQPEVAVNRRGGGGGSNLSGYAVLPRYKKSVRSTTSNNNNSVKYQQLHNKTTHKRPHPTTTTTTTTKLASVHDGKNNSSSGRQSSSPDVSDSPSARRFTTSGPLLPLHVGGQEINGGCHVLPRSDGLLSTRRKMEQVMAEHLLSPDEMNNRKEGDPASIRSDVSPLPADKSTSASVLVQARHPTWLPRRESEAPSPTPLRPTIWREKTDDHVTSSRAPAQNSSATSDEEAPRQASNVDRTSRRQERHRRPTDDDRLHGDCEVRPSGVIIRKKYRTGFVLGRYKSESPVNDRFHHPPLSHLPHLPPPPSSHVRTPHYETTLNFPNRRRDIFTGELPSSDSTTALLPLRSPDSCRAHAATSSSADNFSLPLIGRTDEVMRVTTTTTMTTPDPGEGSALEMEVVDSGRRTRGQRFLSFLKSFLEFLFSTVGLFCCLTGYVCLGGLIFQRLESPNERRINREMKELRISKVNDLWKVTAQMNVLHPQNWSRIAEEILENYTLDVFNSVKKLGWDGKEDDDSQDLQWSFAGSLLYSITVITTIGYGHIAPKTDWGRIITMLYAIVGIPLTLLTITNLGGFMATAFRFLYRNICCRLVCVCCRNKTRLSHPQKSANRQLVLMGRTVTATTIPPERGGGGGVGGGGRCPSGKKQVTSFNLASGGSNPAYSSQSQTSFLPLKTSTSNSETLTTQPHSAASAAKDEEQQRSRQKLPFWKRQKLKRSLTESDTAARNSKAKTSLAHSQSLQSGRPEDSEEASGHARRHRKHRPGDADACRRDASPESRRLPWRERFDDIFSTDDIKEVKVPILVSLLLITGYIGLGALLFSFWEEDWSYLIGCYFCFVTLSTIGFGDYVPGTGADDWNNQAKLVLCAMYLFVGLALIAMCFDLMLEQVRCRFRQVGTYLGILDDGGKRRKMKMMKMTRRKKTKMKMTEKEKEEETEIKEC